LKASIKNGAAQPVALVIDDDQLFRRSIARILEAHGYTTATYESLAQFTAAKAIPQFGCAILDLNLPDSNGLQIQDRLTRVAPALAVIFLSGFGQVSSSVRAMKAGAVDFLEKPVEDSVLLQAVERAVDRSRRLYDERRELEELQLRFRSLSAREQDVFALITSGLLNKQAGAELGVKEKTVKVYRAQLMAKMRAASFADLVKIAQRLGLKRTPASPISSNRTNWTVTTTDGSANS
jgi:FixJ family two-component response regulator